MKIIIIALISLSLIACKRGDNSDSYPKEDSKSAPSSIESTPDGELDTPTQIDPVIEPISDGTVFQSSEIVQEPIEPEFYDTYIIVGLRGGVGPDAVLIGNTSLDLLYSNSNHWIFAAGQIETGGPIHFYIQNAHWDVLIHKASGPDGLYRNASELFTYEKNPETGKLYIYCFLDNEIVDTDNDGVLDVNHIANGEEIYE